MALIKFGWAAYPSYQVPLMGAQGAFPARQISYYYYKEKDVLSSFFNLPVLQYDSIFDILTSKRVAT